MKRAEAIIGKVNGLLEALAHMGNTQQARVAAQEVTAKLNSTALQRSLQAGEYDHHDESDRG